ncbi:hypothetical protein Taro_044546, partial [Colocasia esculenta]|nr:hypothetical protein [Colocasia esculenta]
MGSVLRLRLGLLVLFSIQVLACSCVPWLAYGPLEGPCVPCACWACLGLQASSSAWFLLCLPYLFARCLALEGLSHSEVVSISWDPHPREPVEGVLWAMSVLELAADLADSGAKGKMRFGQRRRVVCRALLSGAGFQVYGGTGVCAFPTLRCVRGLGWFCLWALDLVVRDVVLTWLLHGLGGCAEGCFCLVPNPVGFCGSRVWIGSFSCFLVSLDSFSMLPFPVWYVCGLWATPGWSIPWVCLPTGVA